MLPTLVLLVSAATAMVHAGHGGIHTGAVRTAPHHGGHRPSAYSYLGIYGDYSVPAFDSYPAQINGGTNAVPVIYPASSPPPPEPPVHSVIHEYGPPEDTVALDEQQDAPILYLIAFRDGNIRAAMTYWLDGGVLHYLDRDHQQGQAPLATVDRDLSAQLNRERHVPFNIR